MRLFIFAAVFFYVLTCAQGCARSFAVGHGYEVRRIKITPHRCYDYRGKKLCVERRA